MLWDANGSKRGLRLECTPSFGKAQVDWRALTGRRFECDRLKLFPDFTTTVTAGHRNRIVARKPSDPASFRQCRRPTRRLINESCVGAISQVLCRFRTKTLIFSLGFFASTHRFRARPLRFFRRLRLFAFSRRPRGHKRATKRRGRTSPFSRGRACPERDDRRDRQHCHGAE